MRQIFHIFDETLPTTLSSGEKHDLCLWTIEELTGWSRTEVLLRRDVVLDESLHLSARHIAVRLAAGEPIQYIFGRTDFMGRSLLTRRGVLIPRPETAELVMWILDDYDHTPRSVMDMGTGSGCIALSLKGERPMWDVRAVDVSDDAIALARQNASRLDLPIMVEKADVFTMKPQPDRLDILVSNPPYVLLSERAAMEPNVLQHEPESALFVPDDEPLVYYSALARYGRVALRSGGALYVEINRQKGQDVCQLLTDHGYSDVTLRQDMQHNDRMVRAIK